MMLLDARMIFYVIQHTMFSFLRFSPMMPPRDTPPSDAFFASPLLSREMSSRRRHRVHAMPLLLRYLRHYFAMLMPRFSAVISYIFIIFIISVKRLCRDGARVCYASTVDAHAAQCR